MTGLNKAIQDSPDTVHYSTGSIDEDVEEDYGPELSPEQELGMMSDEEFDDFIDEHLACKHRWEASTGPLVSAIRDLVEKHPPKQP